MDDAKIALLAETVSSISTEELAAILATRNPTIEEVAPLLDAVENYQLIDHLRSRGLVMVCFSASDLESYISNQIEMWSDSDESVEAIPDEEIAKLQQQIFDEHILGDEAMESFLVEKGNEFIDNCCDTPIHDGLLALAKKYPVDSDQSEPQLD